MAVLPNGKDPDDLIEASGPDEFRKVIISMQDLLSIACGGVCKANMS